MNHRDELLRLIEADLDGEISADERTRLEAALREDLALAAEAAELRRLRAVFRAVPAATAPDGFTADVLGATVGVDATARERRSGFRIIRAAPWIAGLAAAGLLAVMLGPWADNGGRFAERAPTETADAPVLDEWVVEREMLDRPRATERGDGVPDTESGPVAAKRSASAPAAPARGADVADTREVSEKPLRDAEESGARAPDSGPDDRLRKSGRGAVSRKAGDESPTPVADPDPSEPNVPAPERAPATTTAEAPPRETGAVVGGGGAGSRGEPETRAPQPVKPMAPTAPGAEAAEAMDLLREATASSAEPATRRYVVFEDEAAARRFVASLRTLAASSALAEEKAAPGEADDSDWTGGKKAEGPVTDAGDEGRRLSGSGSGNERTRDRGAKDGGPQDSDGPATGGVVSGPASGGGAGAAGAGPSRSSSTSFGAGAAPRVLDRVALATSDPAVGRAFARAPAGGVFGENVPAELLEAAEVSFQLVARERRGSRSAPGAETGAVAESAGANESEQPGADEVPADAPRAEAPVRASPGKSKNAAARVEIVVVVVPKGSLPEGTRLGDDTPR